MAARCAEVALLVLLAAGSVLAQSDALPTEADAAKLITEIVNEPGGKVGKKDRPMVCVDPVSGETVAVWSYRDLKITSETVTQILGWVDAFGKLDADKRLDAKGMTSWPVNR